MIKLLILSMSFPYPLRAGGKIRVFNLIRHLSRSCEITLVSLATEEEARFVPELRKFCRRVETVPVSERGIDLWGHRLRSLLRMGAGIPAEMALKQYPAFRRTLDRLLTAETFDLIQVEFTQILPNLLSGDSRPEGERVVWSAHEILHQRLLKRAEGERGFGRWFWSREGRLTRDYEMATARTLRHAIAVSDREAECLRSWNSNLDVAVVPNGVDTAYYDEVEVDREPRSIIFTGWMRHFPNLDAALFLLREIMPLLIRRVPDARLYLVGDPVPEQIRALASKLPQVTLTGFVEDIRPFVKRASVAIVPLRVGGGTHLKVLEAMAARTPVVATPVGVEGLPVRHDRHAWIAEDAAGLVEGIVRLMEDQELRTRIVGEARGLIEKEFEWSAIAARQLDFYESILRRGSRAVSPANAKG